ncbi:10058_t:CDS:2 [Funneliformis caledonium]|uniref:10058_t:CDS:1 n=1 Tax=Funneliformis caledonium TaxID=1117310 RepID=A0A9N8YS50_9GLOM|nr:10058_t:CDS:2 [Funneliformis caledonium]
MIQKSDYPYNLEPGIDHFLIHKNTIDKEMYQISKIIAINEGWEKLEKFKDRLITYIFNLGLIDTKLHYRTLISPEHRRSTNYPHFHLFIKKRTQIIILEGNIACTKSTQGTILKNYIEQLGHTVEFLDEQVEEWEPLLNKFYRSQKEYRFALQLMITKDRLSQYKEAQKKYPNYVIMARSHVSGQIFWELQKPELIEHPGSFIKGTHDPEEFRSMKNNQENIMKKLKFLNTHGYCYDIQQGGMWEFSKRHYHQTDTVMAPRRVNLELSAGTYEIVSSIDRNVRKNL